MTIQRNELIAHCINQASYLTRAALSYKVRLGREAWESKILARDYIQTARRLRLDGTLGTLWPKPRGGR